MTTTPPSRVPMLAQRHRHGHVGGDRRAGRAARARSRRPRPAWSTCRCTRRRSRWMTVPIADSLAGGAQPGRLAAGNANIVPYQVFDCADDAILVAAGNDALYQRLCKAMELSELAHDPRFVTNGAARHEPQGADRAAESALSRSACARVAAAAGGGVDPVRPAAIGGGGRDGRADAVARHPAQDPRPAHHIRRAAASRSTACGRRCRATRPALGQHDHLIAPRGAATLSQETA